MIRVKKLFFFVLVGLIVCFVHLAPYTSVTALKSKVCSTYKSFAADARKNDYGRKNDKCCLSCCCCQDQNIIDGDNNARNKFIELQKKKEVITTGQIYVRNKLLYNIDEIPENIDILTVSFLNKDEECTNNDEVPCGNVKKLFRYKNNENKQEYLKDIKKLKKKKPNIFLLLEINDNNLYKKDTSETWATLDAMVSFMRELRFDGINFAISTKKLMKDLKKLRVHVQFYIKYINDIYSKLKETDIMAITVNAAGAISNLHFSSELPVMTDDDSPFNRFDLKKLGPNDEIYKIAESPVAGVTIPIIKFFANRLDIVTIYDDLDALNVATSREYTYDSVYQSYLYYAKKHRFTIQLGFDLNKKKSPLSKQNKNFLKFLAGKVKANNKQNHLGDGFSIFGLGSLNPAHNEKDNIEIFQEVFVS